MSNREKYASEIMKLFIHRKNVYAVQVKSGDEYIYVPKYELLTQDEIQRHLEGKITLGVYALNEDNTVKWLCLDVDHAHVEKPEETCKIIAEKCASRFGKAAVRIEESGTAHNFHVWVFFEEPIQALYARSLGLQILEGINKGVEIFPKQTALTGKRLGNLVKLPLGLHGKSGKWSKMNIEGIKPCTVDVTKIEAPTARPFEEKPRLEGYKGKDPNCIEKIKKGVKKGARSNSGIVYAGYLYNFRQLEPEHAYYLFRLWNTRNKPRLDENELRSVFEQAVKGGYVFGCGHDYVKEFCVREGCVFGNEEDKR